MPNFIKVVVKKKKDEEYIINLEDISYIDVKNSMVSFIHNGDMVVLDENTINKIISRLDVI